MAMEKFVGPPKYASIICIIEFKSFEILFPERELMNENFKKVIKANTVQIITPKNISILFLLLGKHLIIRNKEASPGTIAEFLLVPSETPTVRNIKSSPIKNRTIFE